MKTRTAIGLSLMLVSLPLFAAGGFALDQAIKEENRQVIQKRETETQCLRQLEAIPKAQVKNSGQITVTVGPITNPMEALTTASVAVMMCPTRDLIAMCLGDQCNSTKKGIVSLVLTLAPSTKGLGL